MALKARPLRSPSLFSYPGFGGAHEWHCRLRRKDLGQRAATPMAQTISIARFLSDLQEGVVGRFFASTRSALGAGPSLVYHLVRFETFLES